MKNILNNQEHREAAQLAANQRAIDIHGEEKFNKISEAAAMLKEAGIPAVIFAETNEDIPLLQINNFMDFMEFEGGVATKESQIKSIKNNHNLAFSFINYFCGMCSRHENPPLAASQIMPHLYNAFVDKLKNGKELPEIEDILKEDE